MAIVYYISYIVKKMVIIAHHPRRGGKADARVAPMIATTTNCLGKISKKHIKKHMISIKCLKFTQNAKNQGIRKK